MYVKCTQIKKTIKKRGKKEKKKGLSELTFQNDTSGSREDLGDKHSRKNPQVRDGLQPVKEVAGREREEERGREVAGEAVRDQNARKLQPW